MSDAERSEITWLPREYLGLLSHGRLGMTACPGRWTGNRPAALRQLRACGTDLLVSLCTNDDFVRYGLPGTEKVLQKEAEDSALALLRFPIEDYGCPASPEALWPSVRCVRERIAAGETVVVHCGAGLGRTGTFVVCCVLAAGYGLTDALRVVREVRPGAVETTEQEAFLEKFAQRVLFLQRLR